MFRVDIFLVSLGTRAIRAVTIPIDVFPDLTTPMVTVLAEAHGMAAKEVELSRHLPHRETAVNGFPSCGTFCCILGLRNGQKVATTSSIEKESRR